ncbi:hypothetical protein, partial [Brasilonema bromeliae]|uniref:hypothetical protein n=1 Tax=Brasilonema bromeliae TaxID=383615 RepID=UPI001B7CF597
RKQAYAQRVPLGLSNLKIKNLSFLNLPKLNFEFSRDRVGFPLHPYTLTPLHPYTHARCGLGETLIYAALR